VVCLVITPTAVLLRGLWGSIEGVTVVQLVVGSNKVYPHSLYRMLNL